MFNDTLPFLVTPSPDPPRWTVFCLGGWVEHSGLVLFLGCTLSIKGSCSSLSHNLLVLQGSAAPLNPLARGGPAAPPLSSGVQPRCSWIFKQAWTKEDDRGSTRWCGLQITSKISNCSSVSWEKETRKNSDAASGVRLTLLLRWDPSQPLYYTSLQAEHDKGYKGKQPHSVHFLMARWLKINELNLS